MSGKRSGLWVSPTKFVQFSSSNSSRKSLSSEIVTRSRSIDFSYLSGYLPDPDPILKAANISIPTYRELSADPHVFSCIQSRKGGTLSKEWSIDPASNSRKDKYAADLVNDQFSILQKQMQRICSEILDAVLYGISPIEVLWATDGQSIMAADLVGKPPEWFVFDENNELRFLTKASMLQGESITSPKKILLPRHLASYQNPYGERALSRCFWPVTFKKGGFKFWVIFTEKYGMPFLLGKVPPGTGRPERTALADILEDAVQDAVAVVNDNESVEFKESGSKAASAQIYDWLIKASDAEISKALLGQTLTTEIGDKGSYAASQTHQEVRLDLVEMGDKLVVGTFAEFIEWLVDLNLDGAQYPTFSFIEEEDVQKDRSERDKNLVMCGWRPMPSYFEKSYNMEPEDFMVLGPAPAISGPGQEQGGGTGPAIPGQEQGGETFQENSSIPSFAQQRFSPAQQAIEDMVDQTVGQSQKYFEGMSEDIVKLAQSCSNFEELKQKILAAFPDIDASKHEELLQQAIFAAEMWGRYQVQQERKRRGAR